MAILTIAQTRSFAAKAGFTGNGLNTVVAIAQAESGLSTTAHGINTDGSEDKGIVQINSKAHPEVPATCAYDPACAMSAAYKISKRGTDFTPWTTYTSGTYKQFLSSANNGSTALTGKQWYQYPITNGYSTSQVPGNWDSPHYALDLGAPRNTPFYFLESGTITQADYAVWNGKPGGGEVFLQPDRGNAKEYVYHLDDITTSVGKHVSVGEVVGYSGGQNSGGKHPVSSAWSSGEHIHFGLFLKYINTVVGSRPFGPSPISLLNQAKANNLIGHTGTGGDTNDTSSPDSNQNAHNSASGPSLSDQVHEILTEFPGFIGIAVALDQAEQFPGVKWYGDSTDTNPLNQVGNGIRSVLDTIASNTLPLAVRSLFLFIGFLLLIGLLWNLVQSTGLADKAVNLAASSAMVAA